MADKSEGTLFKSQSELAGVLADILGIEQETVRPHLNRMLKMPGELNEREMPKEYKEEIQKLIQKKLHKDERILKTLTEDFEEAYKVLKNKTNFVTVNLDTEDFKEYMSWSDHANKGVVFINDPGEAYYGSEKNKADIDEIMNRLFNSLFSNFVDNESGLMEALIKNKRFDLSYVGEPNFSIEFYLPSRQLAKNQFAGIYTFFLKRYLLEEYIREIPESSRIDNNLDIQSLMPLLQIAERFLSFTNHHKDQHGQSQSFLKINTIDRLYARKPEVYLYSQEGRKEKHWTGFELKLENGRLLNLLQFDQESVNIWREDFYDATKEEPHHYGIREIRLEPHLIEIRNDVIGRLKALREQTSQP